MEQKQNLCELVGKAAEGKMQQEWRVLLGNLVRARDEFLQFLIEAHTGQVDEEVQKQFDFLMSCAVEKISKNPMLVLSAVPCPVVPAIQAKFEQYVLSKTLRLLAETERGK